MNIEERITALVNEKIADRPDLFLVGVKVSPGDKVLILVDGDQGVAIQDCAQISRHVGFCLEEENVIEQAYNLEVSSPGIDLPLQTTRQYHKNIGRNLQIKLAEGLKIEGTLLEVLPEGIILEEIIKEKGKKSTAVERQISFSQMLETKVLISFK
ncbi:MAG: ribosome assembly cofactor RimP [Sphingobacteriaceae bacterium]